MYQVTIIKEETKEVKEQKYQQISETGNTKDNGPMFDYVPYKTMKEEETVIFSQRVEDLDIEGVIKATNNIK